MEASHCGKGAQHPVGHIYNTNKVPVCPRQSQGLRAVQKDFSRLQRTAIFTVITDIKGLSEKNLSGWDLCSSHEGLLTYMGISRKRPNP